MTDLRLSQTPPQLSAAPDSDGDAALRAKVAERLRRVCDRMPPEAFDTLMDDIYAIKIRWRSNGEWHDD
jgi:hypothetical protein